MDLIRRYYRLWLCLCLSASVSLSLNVLTLCRITLQTREEQYGVTYPSQRALDVEKTKSSLQLEHQRQQRELARQSEIDVCDCVVQEMHT